MKQIIFVIFFSIFTFSVGANEIDDLTKLADDGDPIAQNNLGHYYLYLSEDNPDDKELLEILIKSYSDKHIDKVERSILKRKGFI